MFFGSLAGSGLGLVVRTSVIRALGGYQAAEYPSADYFFMTRLARDYRFIQLRSALAISRWLSVRALATASCRSRGVNGQRVSWRATARSIGSRWQSVSTSSAASAPA